MKRADRPKLTTEIKHDITRRWHAEFPTLGIWQPMHLLRRAGPVLIGICLDRKSGGHEYFPQFHIHTLGNGVQAASLTFAQALRGGRHMSYTSVELWREQEQFAYAVAYMRQVAFLSLDGPITRREVESVYAEFVSGVRPSNGNPENNFADLVTMALWCGSVADAKANIRWGVERMSLLQHYSPSRIKRWRDAQEARCADPHRVHETVAEEIRQFKLEKLPVSDFVCE